MSIENLQEQNNSIFDDMNIDDLLFEIPTVSDKEKIEIEEKITPDIQKINVDIRQIEKMLGINPEDKLEFVQKQVRLEADLFEDIKLLAKYESISAVKFINSAIKTYVLNRQAILDKIYELKNLQEANSKNVDFRETN